MRMRSRWIAGPTIALLALLSLAPARRSEEPMRRTAIDARTLALALDSSMGLRVWRFELDPDSLHGTARVALVLDVPGEGRFELLASSFDPEGFDGPVEAIITEGPFPSGQWRRHAPEVRYTFWAAGGGAERTIRNPFRIDANSGAFVEFDAGSLLPALTPIQSEMLTLSWDLMGAHGDRGESRTLRIEVASDEEESE